MYPVSDSLSVPLFLPLSSFYLLRSFFCLYLYMIALGMVFIAMHFHLHGTYTMPMLAWLPVQSAFHLLNGNAQNENNSTQRC